MNALTAYHSRAVQRSSSWTPFDHIWIGKPRFNTLKTLQQSMYPIFARKQIPDAPSSGWRGTRNRQTSQENSSRAKLFYNQCVLIHITRYAQKIQPPYDFSGEFERIYNAAKADSYDNEYEFGFDLYRLFQRTHVSLLQERSTVFLLLIVIVCR